MSTHDRATASAPGRVNLIGEHTDYHDGFVLPMVMPQRTHISLQRRQDRRVRAESRQLGGEVIDYELGHERPGRGWLDYVQGVTYVLAGRGMAVTGFDVSIDSTVPVGAGVSSSAALEVALLRALRDLFRLDLDDLLLARVAQAAETDFVGAPVGIMDQIACSLGLEGEALFVDTRTLATDRVPVPPSIDVIVIHSGQTHAHAGGDYVTRRRESFEAAALLGVQRLRDVSPTALERIAALPVTLARRARHVVTENARVVDAVDALRRGNAWQLGHLFAASHASMRDDYEISTPEIDTLVNVAARQPAVYGARLTGGGFGGAVVAIAAPGNSQEVASTIAREYRLATGQSPHILLPSSNR